MYTINKPTINKILNIIDNFSSIFSFTISSSFNLLLSLYILMFFLQHKISCCNLCNLHNNNFEE
ncbi:hypothetical protein HERIO_2512 [Hepatospora eriocheir]|uniref:Uncharacterized protein n=1 Tax=Hepatospora eriocheir TaxID=1081669 RepID=A0A1X0Q6N1_9MICR|nr:hypothetical protein HERIO_2512 [Hepatospora eriocheir]